MADRFELFRLSLLPRIQGNLFDQRELTREQYLRTLLQTQLTFKHWNEDFHYVPAPSVSVSAVLIGRIGRSVSSLENEPPDHELAEIVRETWKAAIIVLDPQDHGDGQKVALQADPKVGKPNALVASLVRALNERNPIGHYDIEVAPIVDARSFWDFATAHPGEITRLQFEFVAPNMFGGHDSITEDLRDYRTAEGAQRVDLTLTSKDGLRTETERIKESVDYAVRGGGVIRAKTKAGKRFNSSHRISSTTVDEPSEAGEPRLVRAARWVTKILGRE